MTANEPSDRDAYLFGDSDVAARRLQLLAEVFEPATRDFLARFVPLDPREILDVGCGPGYTTRLLARLFPAAGVLGIDTSPRYVELARTQTSVARILFEVADATQSLPPGPFDLVYARYLLTHVADPLAAIALWSARLNEGGAIAIEENDAIETSEPAFAQYLNIVEAMLADGGQRLYVGAEIDRLAELPALAKTASQRVPIAVSNGQAARMFSMNIRGWRRQPFVERHYPAAGIDALAERLDGLAQLDDRQSSITFVRRRLVFTRLSSEGVRFDGPANQRRVPAERPDPPGELVSDEG